MSKITANDFIKRAIGKEEVEVTTEEFIDLIFVMDINNEEFELNNPYFLGVKVIVTDEVEPRFTLAELEKIWTHYINWGDRMYTNPTEVPLTGKEFFDILKDTARVEAILK